MLRLLPCSLPSSRLHCRWRCMFSGISVIRFIRERPRPFLELRFLWRWGLLASIFLHL